ncbi:MAG: acetolactate synthase [Chthoniobacterales bacterium]
MTLTRTTEKLSGDSIHHFSVFLHNKVGALLEIVKLLNRHDIVVLALSILDSSESSIGRIIVTDPEATRRLFDEHDIPYSVCEIMVVEMPEGAAELSKVLAALLMAEVNVYFSYPLLTRPRGQSALALHLDDLECASSVLRGEGFRLLTQDDISR